MSSAPRRAPSVALPGGRFAVVPGGRFAVACCVVALVRAYQLRWTCDDAFVSFRYAENLTNGLGLVFNAGERVEGYTNFLWTILIAPAFPLGVRPETWTQLWGAAFYAASVALLGSTHAALAGRLRGGATTVGFAAIAAAVHADWAIHAVSGLETAAFTFFALAAYVCLIRDATLRSTALAGALIGLATLCRPDGVVFAAAALAWLGGRALLGARIGVRRRDELARAGAFLVVLTLVAGAHLVFRLRYYGDPFPNTYYAKSADAAWYQQGLRYLWLYLLRYWPLALAPFAMLWIAAASFAHRTAGRALVGPTSLAMMLGLAHVAWVVRVGGDFMFARFLVPDAPFFLIVLDACLTMLRDEGAPAARTAVRLASAALLAMIAFLPSPIPPNVLSSGIADERAFYSTERVQWMEDAAARVKPILDGLDVRLAFYSSQARFVYRTRVPIAIECETGLTDAFIARQPLDRRLRVGHEKKAPPTYVIGARKAHLAFVSRPTEGGSFERYVPWVPIDLGGVRMQLLHWDPELVTALRARGVVVPDFPSMLDAAGPALDRLDAESARREYERARHFYFDFVDDPARERAFLERIGRSDHH